MRRDSKKSKIFFVTGAMGFIGTHWCKKLLKEGHFVYGLDIKKCSQTGSKNVYYISPKSGNCVSYEVGRKYENKLFKIPDCLKNNFSRFQISEIESCLKISGFFVQKISDTHKKYIFRNQLINMISRL